MHIKTNKFSMSRKEFFLISARKLLRPSMIVCMIIIFLGLLFRPGDYILRGVVIFILICFYLIWRSTCSKENKIFFKERRYEITDDFLYAYLNDGTEDKLNLENITKITATKKYYLIFMSKATFFYLPIDALVSEEDKNTLDNFIKEWKLKKKNKNN